jgi:proteasome lid subunit RPN8/RPN11
MIQLQQQQIQQIVSQARESDPDECCGLIGGNGLGAGQTIYPLRNIATDKTVSYEAAPEELFSAQRRMRERGEQLIAIYHSHPRSSEPQPSDTDVRLAYYPAATYLIVGLGGSEPTIRAFCVSEREQQWYPVEYEIIDG